MKDNKEIIEMLALLKRQAEEVTSRTVLLNDVTLDSFNFVINKAIKALNRGWRIEIGMYESRFICSCGYIKILDNNIPEWNFCPVCGETKEVTE